MKSLKNAGALEANPFQAKAFYLNQNNSKKKLPTPELTKNSEKI